jgi:ribosomal protein S18 acetylase RimI-like enzyme
MISIKSIELQLHDCNRQVSNRIECLLNEIGDDFSPKLNEIVDIHEYSEKMANKACVIMAYNNEQAKDVGLIAFYANRTSRDYCYITSIGIDREYYGEGLAQKMLNEAKTICRKRGFERVKLDVSRRNSRAQSFYYKNGFKLEKVDKVLNKIRMSFKLQS